MDYQAVDGGREYVARLAHGEDWRGQIEAFAAEEGVDAAFFVGLGAVSDAELYFYDQDTTEYGPVRFDEPFEVTNCVGNVSWLDGERFAHTHVSLSREDGSAVGGHLNRATTFAGELYVREFAGEAADPDADPDADRDADGDREGDDSLLVREHDPVTDLDLWEL